MHFARFETPVSLRLVFINNVEIDGVVPKSQSIALAYLRTLAAIQPRLKSL